MALTKSLVPISFSGGVDTKKDPKQLSVGSYLQVKNVVFDTLDMFRLRNGYDLIELKTAANVSIQDADTLTKFKNELCLIADSKFYGFSQATQSLEQRGKIYSALPKLVSVLNNGTNHECLDSIITEGLRVVVYRDTITLDVRYSVQDINTGSLLVSNEVVATAAQRVKVSNIQNIVYIVYAQGANLRYRRFNVLNPSVLETAVNLFANVDTSAPNIDTVSAGSKFIVAYNSSVVGAKVQLFDVESSGLAGSAVGITSSNGSRCIDLTLDPQNRVLVAYASSTVVAFSIYAYTLVGALLAHTVVETISNVRNVSVCQVDVNYCIRYEIEQSLPQNHFIKQATVTLAGAVSGISVFLRSLGIRGKHFLVGGKNYLVVGHASQLQNTTFVVDSDGEIAIKSQAGTSGGHITTGSLPKSNVNGLTVDVAVQSKSRNVSENGTFFSLLGVSALFMDFSPTDQHQNAPLGENLHIAGGILSMYDGDVVVEHGFHIFPESITALAPDLTSGSMASGNYGYQAVYSWVDNNGQQHQSVPSPILNVDFVSSKAPSATLSELVPNSTPVVVTSSLVGQYRNGDVLNVVVAAAAANPTNTILASVSGTTSNTTITVTPNNGTNNGGVPVTLTTAELSQLINSGTVSGKTVTLTDTNLLLYDYSSSGGDDKDIVAGTFTATLAGGCAVAPSGTLSTTVPVIVYSRTVGTSKNGTKFTLQVAPAAANPTNTILAVYTGTASNIVLTITPNNGTNNGGTPVNLTTAELVQLLSIQQVVGKSVTITDASSLRNDLRATGGGPQNLADGGEGDGLVCGLLGGQLVAAQRIQVPTLRVTSKQDVTIDLYRTEDAGSIFYKVSSVSSPTFNDKSVDSVIITDTLKDADLISREALYTTGGVLENTGAPSARVVAAHTGSNRIFLVGERPNILLYSKIQLAGRPVEFNDGLEKSVDPVGGDITALASMDEKLVIFESDAIFYIAGSGPNNLGQQDSFTEPERVSTDVGCIEPRSVVLTPDGLMFKSRKGIYLVNRAMGLEYIGDKVESYNNLTITSAKVVGELNQVRFSTSDGDCLVYNYYKKQWGTYDNHRALSAEVLNNDYYYVRNNQELFKENRTSFGDNGVPINMVIETGWITVGQIQSFGRLYKMLLLGEFKSPHKLRVRIAYDFAEAWTQEELINTADFIDSTPYGEYSNYGDPESIPYGGDGNVYQMRIDFSQQKCQAFKLLIETIQEQVGEALSLSAATLQVGLKKGAGKFAENKQYGTE